MPITLCNSSGNWRLKPLELKEYQRRAIERYDDYLKTLYAEKLKAERAIQTLKEAEVDIPIGTGDWPKNAWKQMETLLPRVKTPNGLKIPDYITRRDACERSVPHVCLKVPTGGGKTLLATECIGRVQTDFFKSQTGLVLWVVPTVQIYRQTWKALANREHSYRQTLERASGGRVKVFEKDDPFTKADTENYLCVMLVRLAATNRSSNKEFLKIFRDTGKYSSFFPETDDDISNKALLDIYRDLEINDLVDAGTFSAFSVKHSLVNTLKMLRPVIVIDEGHKAYSNNTRESLNGFNPSFILELTATPNVKQNVSNVLVDVSGTDLKDEQMIKLPINVINTKNGEWQNTLTMAHGRLTELDDKADKLQAKDGRYIRPIMVIRVERTGKDQRDGTKIHALDARDYLIEKLSIKEDEIRIKSSETDELGDTDLFDPLCPVKYIITKEALQEGWDCSFAYILTLLDKTTAQTAMTQMVGRILRQPDARITSIEELNMCYVFCYDQDVNTAVDNVRKGLEDEGMTGLSEFINAYGESNGLETDKTELRLIKRGNAFHDLKIFLPKVLHKDGNNWRDIDYERDILSNIPWQELTYDIEHFLDSKDSPITTETSIDVKNAKDLSDHQGELSLITNIQKHDMWIEKKLDLAFLSRPLIDVIPNPWQGSRILLETIEALNAKGHDDEAIYNSRLYLLDDMKRYLKNLVNEYSEMIFKNKLEGGEISFRLINNGNTDLNFEILHELKTYAKQNEKKLFKESGDKIENSLFEVTFEKDLNNLEKDFALYLANSDAVTWWHRMVAKHDYSLQGWQRNKIYPDFIACMNKNKLFVMETKGLHLKGNDDTEYKTRLFELLTNYHEEINRKLDLQTDNKTKILFHMLEEDTWWSDINKFTES